MTGKLMLLNKIQGFFNACKTNQGEAGGMKKGEEARVRTKRMRRKSGSVEEIGFGPTRRNKKDEGEEEVGGQQRGRGRRESEKR